jgi:hypothetical protein
MNPPAVIAPQPGQVAPVSATPELSDTLSQALYDLIAQQPFFKGLNPINCNCSLIPPWK